MSDLYVTERGDGMELIVDHLGNPTLTGGLDTAVYLSGFVGPWWGNEILPAEEQYTSRVRKVATDVLNLRTVRNVEEALRAALSWFIQDGIAASVDLEAEIVSRERVNVRITIVEPDRNRLTYRYGLNWASQEIHVIEEGRI